MTARLALGLVFHQHQPVGNFDFVFEELFAKSYEPLVGCLERHPAIKAGLHYSGPLIDWLALHRPAYLERVAALVARGQVEMLGGAYYEPILPAIIEEDRVGQLAKMREAVAGRFGAAPSGAWLAERVWETGLPTSLAAAGYNWTLVDDVHFGPAGLAPDALRGWYLTEDQGRTVGLFPSSTRLRYLIPWADVEACIAYLRERAEAAPESFILVGDDGEKFGGWPTTYDLCWEGGWVDAFFDALERESEWLETVHPGSWQAEHPAEGLVYLPAMSYVEMGEWALPPEAQHTLKRARQALSEAGMGNAEWLLRGGHWRNFLVRYPEANLLQKRLIALSRQAREANNPEALDHVWQAECNCPYWHGVFGGVYLENIRHANFGHAAKADAMLSPGPRPPEVRDWDFDGRGEVGLRSHEHFVLVAPGRGGAILQWELRRRGWNMTHVVALRPEAYHADLQAAIEDDGDGPHSIHGELRVKDERVLSYGLRYDGELRMAAQDTVLAPGSGREAYEAHRAAGNTECLDWEVEGQTATLRCRADGASYEKRIDATDALTVTYAGTETARLFSEWNLSLPGEPLFEAHDGRFRITAGDLVVEAAHNGDAVWSTQVFSISNTEGGLELAPQGWCIVFTRELGANLPPFRISWTSGAREDAQEAQHGGD